MKIIDEKLLYSLLYAAYTYASYNSPAERINEYLVANSIVPPNIRKDSQLSDVWRDYQQVLAELGLMYSTRVTGGIIEPTSCGLHLLDNQNKFHEILTNQVLLYQYPNGGKREYADEQLDNSVLLRPAVLVWRVISIIKEKGGMPYLTSREIRDYLMHCCTHDDAEVCADTILKFRLTGKGLEPNSLQNAGRNAGDWITLLGNTLVFDQVSRPAKVVILSKYAVENFEELDSVIKHLENEQTFWKPTFIDDTVRRDWYSFYGTLRLEVDLPQEDVETESEDMETNGEEKEIGFGNIGGVQLKDFDPERLNFIHDNKSKIVDTIESSYDANMVANRHRLHDAMVILIANVCSSKGAEVYDDSKSLDLLIRYTDTEYLVEVKTVTTRNYVKRLRYAVGQLLHYDFMLEQMLPIRRKVIAIPSLVPKASGFLPFFNEFLDIDVLSLMPTSNGQVIHCDTTNVSARELFSQIA